MSDAENDTIKEILKPLVAIIILFFLLGLVYHSIITNKVVVSGSIDIGTILAFVIALGTIALSKWLFGSK